MMTEIYDFVHFQVFRLKTAILFQKNCVSFNNWFSYQDMISKKALLPPLTDLLVVCRSNDNLQETCNIYDYGVCVNTEGTKDCQRTNRTKEKSKK